MLQLENLSGNKIKLLNLLELLLSITRLQKLIELMKKKKTCEKMLG